MDRGWWVTVVRAWPQESEKSGLVIRMINNFGDVTEDRHFASVDDAIIQLRDWLEELERVTSSNHSQRYQRDANTTEPIRSDNT